MVVYDAVEEPQQGQEPAAPTGGPFGYLRINVAMAQRALPIFNAQVTVYSSFEERQQDMQAQLQTDASGGTDTISLPAPLLANSLLPQRPAAGQAELPPYTLYYVRITAPNFVTRDHIPVQIFPGVVSNLIINLLPPGENS